jgi:glycosyltransferase involved in cell wall biosynthesis
MSDWNDWNKKGIVNRNYHILNQLLKSDKIGKILHVDFLPYTKKRSLRSYYESQIRNSSGKVIKKGLTSTLRKISNKLYIYSTIDSVFSEKKVYPNINKVLKDLNFNNIILWSYFPMFVGYFDQIKSKIKIFDTVDNWIEHNNFKSYKERLKNNYNYIDKNTDLIFTVSEDLLKLFPNNKNTHWIPNGVDTEKFKINNLEFRIKDKNSITIKKPIIGYVGFIQNRIDMDLIKYIAEQNLNKSIVLIGEVWPDASIEKIKNKKNVYLLGHIKYQELPKYIQQFDIAIIPHKINKFTKSMNPLKLYDYLACGKPVVTTPIAGIENFKDLINIAFSKEEFNNKIQEALKNNTEELEKIRINSIQNHSWGKRIDDILRYIENFIE